MKSVSVSNLKARLSVYIRAVKSGETVLVTEHGRPVAHISPLAPLKSSSLIKAGLVRPALRQLPESFWKKLPRSTLKGAEVTRALLEERDSRR